ncbi:MAG: 50S ribosomal protein L34e [Candidatus Nezhaarchaeota archaeon]|nr:50S ribosomal protein L34e [Candidatus Nezhaarchaeota archaeon]
MVKPGLRGKPRKALRTPGGRSIVRFVKFKRSKARCAWCHEELRGTPSPNRGGVSSLPKSSRRPERPFGGYLCHKCLRAGLLDAVVKASGAAAG